MTDTHNYCPALIVHGSLAVPGGRELAPLINELLDLSFVLKVGTKDCHPLDHISFDTSHEPPNNKAFEDSVTVINPANPSETKDTTLWPVHCVRGTEGANIIPEINASKLDVVVEKGLDRRFEHYSGFADMFGNKSGGTNLDLAALLKDRGVTHVYMVGLTGDCCVKETALHAKQEGFETFVIQDGVRSVDEGEKGWGAAVKMFQQAGVHVVLSTGSELDRVRALQ